MKLILRAAAGTMAMLLHLTASALETRTATVKLDIASQPIDDALLEFSRQTGVQIVFDSREGKDIVTPGLSGVYTPETALKRLLRNSGLHYEYLNERTVAVRAGKPRSSQTEAPAAALRLVQSAESAARATENAGVATDGPRTRGIPEILVRGKRTSNTDIPRTADDVQPYVVFDAQTLERSMAGNLEEFLKTRLPMNMTVITNSQQPELSGNVSSIDLRGLGTDETLILVNGRRLPGIANLGGTGAFDQPDINGIPISAIERVEVLPATASGIYGGGATGGVINIILKSDYDSLEVGMVYDNTFDTDSGTRRFNVTSGFSLEDGRTHVLLTASHSDGNSLAVGDRDFAAKGYALYLQNTLDDFSFSFRPPLATTANIRLVTGTQLSLKNPGGGPARPLGTRIAHVPAGYAGIASDGGAAMIASAGSYNIELPRDLQGLQAGILNSPVVSSAGASIRRELRPGLDAFMELSWNKNAGHVPYASQLSTITLEPANPGNPFNNRVQVVFPLPGLAFDRAFESETRGATAGLILRLPGGWIGQTEYSHGRSRSSYAWTSPVLGAAATAAIASGSLNIFRDLNLYPPDYGALLLASPNNFGGPFDNTMTGTTLRLAGAAGRMPGGPLALSALYEHRKSAADAAYQQTQSATDDSVSRPRYAARYDKSDSFSLEATAPVFSASNARAGLHALDLQASARHDRYRVGGAQTVSTLPDRVTGLYPAAQYTTAGLASSDYTVGLRYAPVADLAFRASYGTGFLPPAVSQITERVNVTSLFIVDPLRERVRVSVPNVTQHTGGNPALDPEQSRSLSAGMVLTPRFAPGLRLSLDLTEISKDGEIAFVDAQTVVDNEAFAAGRVIRGTLTSQDSARGFTAGPITEIYANMINLSKTKVKALDLQLDYLFDTPLGAMRAYALATLLRDHITQFQEGAPEQNDAGHMTRLKWRGNAGLTLERRHWSLDWNMQYFDRYFIYPGGLDEELIPLYTFEQGSDRIPRQTYHDITARFQFGNERLAGTDLLVGIRNVFDQSPPILATFVPSNGYSPFGDPRLRRFTVSLRKRF